MMELEPDGVCDGGHRAGCAGICEEIIVSTSDMKTYRKVEFLRAA